MSLAGMITKEIWHRKVNFLLGVVAVATAVAFFVAFLTAAKASERETARLMLEMGYNLHVISRDADEGQFLQTGLADRTMPADYLTTLASQKNISYNHLLATLEKRITWRDRDIILTGLAPEVCPPGRKTPTMLYEVKPGTVYLGSWVARELGIRPGQKVEIRGKEFQVARCLAESGGVDDTRVQCHIKDAQEILALPDQISEIRAVDCLCFVEGQDPKEILRREIESLLPGAKVVHVTGIASARAKQRQMVRKLFGLIIPFVVIACGVWIAVLAVTNVRDRQQETGILRALGYSTGKIVTLFLGKAILTGLVGAGIGYLVGTALALQFGPDVFKITASKTIQPDTVLLIRSAVFAPVFAAVASFIPTMLAASYDPAVTLREE